MFASYTSTEFQVFLKNIESFINSFPDSGNNPLLLSDLIKRNFKEVLPLLKDNNFQKELDENCTIYSNPSNTNISRQVFEIIGSRQKIEENEEYKLFVVEQLYTAFFLDFYEFTQRGNSPYEINSFLNVAFDNLSKFSQNSISAIFGGVRNIPLRLIKEFYELEEVKIYADIKRTTQSNIAKLEKINSDSLAISSRSENLEKNLKQMESAYNFVGLNQGFEGLHKTKKDEKRNYEINSFLFKVIIIVLVFSEIILISLDVINITKAIPVAFSCFTLIMILLYFFRINLNNLSAVNSQLLQLDLRMTLCKFIESYAERSGGLRGKNKEGFEKFENIIFSSIVSSDEKIPATFDGVEQIAKLIEAIKK